MNLLETMKMALEALEYHVTQTRPIYMSELAITNLRAAIKQYEDAKPVAWLCVGNGSRCVSMCNPYPTNDAVTPLYHAPAVPEEIEKLKQCISEQYALLNKQMIELAAYQAKEGKLSTGK